MGSQSTHVDLVRLFLMPIVGAAVKGLVESGLDKLPSLKIGVPPNSAVAYRHDLPRKTPRKVAMSVFTKGAVRMARGC